MAQFIYPILITVIVLGVFEKPQSTYAPLSYLGVAAIPGVCFFLGDVVTPAFGWPLWLARALPFVGLAGFFVVLWRALSIHPSRCLTYAILFVLALAST